MNKMGIGTAQFGMAYGISNRHGKVPYSVVRSILKEIGDDENMMIDTAAVYGTAETVIGRALPKQHRFRIVTKIPPFKTEHSGMNAAEHVIQNFRRSLRKLKQQSVYGLLFHSSRDLRSTYAGDIMNAALYLKKTGRVQKIGVSVYDKSDLNEILKKFKLDLVQFPLNVLDQRFLPDGYLQRLKTMGLELHARSVFLQGLLLMPLDEIGAMFGSSIKNRLGKYFDFLGKNGIGKVEGALAFVKGVREIDVIIVGVQSLSEMRRDLQFLSSPRPLKKFNFKPFRQTMKSLINPSFWGNIRIRGPAKNNY